MAKKIQNIMRRSFFFLMLLMINLSVHSQILQEKWIVCNADSCKVQDLYYSAGVTMEWNGNCVDGKAHGIGKLIKYSNGEYESTYEGELKNGIREGHGKFSHSDGTVREGAFVDGQMTGKGTMHAIDGQEYTGEFINYRMHGNGVVSFPNGSKFEGFFVSDEMYTGKFTDYDGKITYMQAYAPVAKINERKNGYNPEIGKRVTEYFDENWERCQQKNAKYYRMITYEAPNKPQGTIKDYYITGQLQSDFFCVYIDYDDEGKNFHEGEANWYYKNGKIEHRVYYYNNKVNGANTYYYENGQIAQEMNFEHGVLNGAYKQWYQTGKPRLVAHFENGTLRDNKYIEYDETGLGALVYKEDFQENKTVWEKTNKENVSKILPTNELQLKTFKDAVTARSNYISLEQKSNYSIESIVQKVNGSDKCGYGIIFGFKDWDNYYHFLISGRGNYTINAKFEGVNINIAKWQPSNSINKGNGRNLLKVLKLEDTFVFSINGKIVETTESSHLRGNYYGMLVGGKGEYILENITIKEFVSDEMIKEKTNESSKDIEWTGNGTGIFIDKKGYIATNYHVVEDAKEIEIEFIRNGNRLNYKVEVIQSDKQNDLSILKISDPNFIPFQEIPYNFQTNTKDVGTNVFALGYPIASVMGSEVKFTDGKLSSKTGVQGDVRVYQISVPLQPGNSGGPLFDYDGNFIGITSAGLNKQYFNSENVNYAIKSSYLNNLIEVLPTSITLPDDKSIYNKTLTEKVKILSDYVVLIRIR